MNMVMARILIIDDDVVCRQMLKTLLKKARHDVFEATNGLDAAKQVGTIPADLVFLDVRIPQIDGYKVCRILKENPNTSAVPVIMLTGCSQELQIDMGKQSGADAYLTKPWVPAQLLETVQRLLREKPRVAPDSPSGSILGTLRNLFGH